MIDRSLETRASSSRPRRKAALSLVALLIVLCACWATWSLWLGDAIAAPDTKNVDPVKVARYVASPRFERLPETQRRAYMDAVREEKDKIVSAYARKQISSQEFEAALLNAWISRSLNHTEEFAKIPATGGKRERYVDRIVERGETLHKEIPRPAGSSLWDKDPYELEVVQKLVGSWPAERRAQWEDFRRALRARRAAKSVSETSGIWY
jgi:hypothetical protein